MARIRSIKPEFWTDEKVVELSAFARLLFIGLWNFADDAGRLRFSPKRIKMQILPADNVDISALLGEIARAGLIAVYSVSDCQYLQIKNFERHQKVDKRTESQLPPPNSPEARRIPPLDQGREGIKEGIKEIGETGADAPPPVPDPVAHAVEDWNALAEETGLPAVQKITHARRRLLGERLRDAGGIEGWRAGLAKIRGSPFLLGRQNGNGHGNWRADFDFIIAEKHFTKLMEGGYDGHETNRNGDSDRIKAGVLAAFPELAAGPPPDRAA